MADDHLHIAPSWLSYATYRIDVLWKEPTAFKQFTDKTNQWITEQLADKVPGTRLELPPNLPGYLGEPLPRFRVRPFDAMPNRELTDPEEHGYLAVLHAAVSDSLTRIAVGTDWVRGFMFDLQVRSFCEHSWLDGESPERSFIEALLAKMEKRYRLVDAGLVGASRRFG
jgi:hypothetical protein